MWSLPVKRPVMPAPRLRLLRPVPLAGETDAPAVMYKLETIMLLQLQLIDVGEHLASSRQLQLLSMFLQTGTIVVFNTYHLVMYLLRRMHQPEGAGLAIGTTLLFHGYPILAESVCSVLTIYAFSALNSSFHQMLCLLNKFSIFAADQTLRCRLTQLSVNMNSMLKTYTVFDLYKLNGAMLTSMLGTAVTYIVILIQYAGMGDICTEPEQLELELATIKTTPATTEHSHANISINLT